MKVMVCDVCKQRHSKLTPAFRYFTWKNRQTLQRIRIDTCDDHNKEIKARVKVDLKNVEETDGWVRRGMPAQAAVAKS